MELLRSFRLSIYLTLGIACLSLGYAEGDLLTETPYITVVVLISLAVAYRTEGRWSLSLHAANIVGAVLSLLLIMWLAFRLINKPEGLEFLPFPANLLPYFGPILMVLVPAKLF